MTTARARSISHRDHWYFITAFLLSITIMVVDEQTRLMVHLRMALATSIQPLQWLARMPEVGMNNLSQLISERSIMAGEIDRLRVQNLLLSKQVQELKQLDYENDRLKMLLGVSSQINRGKLLIGTVINHNADPYRQIITINKGANDGIEQGQAVIDAQGLMGQVLSTTLTQSEIMLVTDLSTHIPARVLRSGARGIVQGDGNNGLVLKFIPTTQDIRVGDLIETSGLDKLFPSGLQIGTVVQVNNQAGSIFWQILLHPSAQAATTREVLVLIQPKTTEEPSP